MIDLSDILIATDYDGTLAIEGGKIPERNISAIEKFKQLGGKIAISSGRAEFILELVYPDVRILINAPSVLSNGSYLYDFETGEKYCELYMDEIHIRDILYSVRDVFPFAGTRIIRGGTFITPDRNAEIEYQIKCGYVGNIDVYTYDTLPTDKINKVTICVDEQYLDGLEKYMVERYSDVYKIARSSKRILEIMQKGVSKAAQLPNLMKLMQDRYGKKFTLYGVGDYDNDIDMLKFADVPCCPDNALDEIKEMSKIHLCHAKDGAIADLIEKIIDSRK